jgi:hypothetical protein
MAKQSYATAARQSARRRLPLSVRLSLLILLAALLPLAAVVAINDVSARGTLIKQGQASLMTDSRSNAERVDTYLNERELDGVALSKLPTTPAFLACVLALSQPSLAPAINAQAHCDDPQVGFDFYKGSNCRALNVGVAREANYTQWSLFSATGVELLGHLSSNLNDTACKPVGGSAIPAEDLKPVVQGGTSWISAVYYNGQAQNAYVQVYTPVPVALGSATQVLGFLRATLNLTAVDAIMQSEKGAVGSGSYAFITDENGIRVADTNANDRFTAVAPLSAGAQQLITGEKRFGPVSVNVVGLPGSNTYQTANNQLSNVPWTYYVVSPVATVTQVANDQLRLSLLSAGVIALLAILLGWLLGQQTARPVHEATENLQGAAASLKLLATRQESSASEQQWVVDACKTGLESVRYLADAMNQASRRIIDASNWFGEYWDKLTDEQARRTVAHLQELARYVDEAARRQNVSSDRLGKAITVTTQVSDQLVNGASAAKYSADQLEAIVGDLQRVVGGKAIELPEVEEGEQLEQIERQRGAPALPPAAVRGAQASRMLPPEQAPRQLAAPRAPSMSQVGGYGPYGIDPTPSRYQNDWQQGGRPPAPPSQFGGARRPAPSQSFDAGPSYPGAQAYGEDGYAGVNGNGAGGYTNGGYAANGNGNGYGNGNGRNGGSYDDPRAARRPNPPSRTGWDE